LKIIINTSTLRFGGAIQVSLSFIRECREITGNEYHILVGRGVHNSLLKDEFPSNFYFYDIDFGPVTLFQTRRIGRILSNYEKEIRPDCIITTSGPSYWHSISPHLMGYNLGLYIYPESPFMGLMSPYRKIRYYLKRRLHFYFFRRDATAIIAQTDIVNNRVRKALGKDKVFTISNTYNDFYHKPRKYPERLPEKTDGSLRFITISSYYYHKNIEILPELCDILEQHGYKNIQFVLTIDKENYQRIFGEKYARQVITVGPVKPEECPSLYQECDFLFLPTLAECFSASYPEAMVMKKPIVTTDLDFARSICDNAALYFEAMNPSAAAVAIEHLVENPDLRNQLVENGLNRLKHFDSRKDRADKIISVCKLIINEGKN